MLDTGLKANTLSLSPDERTLYCGVNGGAVLCLDPTDLRVVGWRHAHAGDIYAMAVHPSMPWVATMGMDNFLCLFDVSDRSHPRLQWRLLLRDLIPWNDLDLVPRHPSQSQAVTFHPMLRRLAARSGNSGLVEVDFSGSDPVVVHCTRLHALEDLTTVRYTGDGTQLLSAALGSVVLSNNGLAIADWRLAKNNVHWFEPMKDGTYLVATDDRCVLRFNHHIGEVVAKGSVITRDDLEHVTYNAISGRAFIAGFDRNVYEIDPTTCESLGVAYAAPFKMRWIKTLETDPDTAFVQCFDGGIYRVSLRERRAVRAFRLTPPAVWTACEVSDNTLAFAGEGGEVVFVQLHQHPTTIGTQPREIARLRKPQTWSSTKRMLRQRDGTLWLGQTSGHLLSMSAEGESAIVDLGSAIRDIAFDVSESTVFAALEDGSLRAVNIPTLDARELWRSPDDQPLWAVAHHPSLDQIIVAERGGRFALLAATTGNVICRGPASARVKRVKWLDTDTVLYNAGDTLRRLRLLSGIDEELVAACGNTVEDFIWNREFGYLVLISYGTDVILCDLDSGLKIHSTADQVDYSKGLTWAAAPGAFPLDFFTFGRSGCAHAFRIHSNKCVRLPLGDVALLTERYLVNGRPYDDLGTSR